VGCRGGWGGGAGGSAGRVFVQRFWAHIGAGECLVDLDRAVHRRVFFSKSSVLYLSAMADLPRFSRGMALRSEEGPWSFLRQEALALLPRCTQLVTYPPLTHRSQPRLLRSHHVHLHTSQGLCNPCGPLHQERPPLHAPSYAATASAITRHRMLRSTSPPPPLAAVLQTGLTRSHRPRQ
jgi:hypothetical protein